MRVSGTRAPARFGIGVEMVNLNISVSDARGHYLADLKQADFAVFEDGVPQSPMLFTRDDIPVSLSLLIDTSGSMADKLPVAQEAALRFVRTLRAQDTAQIVQFNERVSELQDFTNDGEALEAAIRRTRASGATALHTAIYVALKDLMKESRGELRRRAIVLLSDGEDTSSAVTDEQVLNLARRSEINVYAIRIRHQQPSETERANYDRSVHFLTNLTRDSGGDVYFASAISELEPIYGRIADELRTLYTIGYVSVNERRDGKWRRIAVLAPNRGNIHVRHRVGYYAPREPTPQP